MKKDPAFLFYGKDFYEGTRTMLPEERACLIDLLVYQHQHGGLIPNNIKRLQMYCSGIDEATLKATLEAKFRLTDKGWQNSKMEVLTEERNSFKDKQSYNGKVGNFFKKLPQIFNRKEILDLKTMISKLSLNNEELYKNWISRYKDPIAMRDAMRTHLVNGNENAIVNGDINEIAVDNGKESVREKPKIVFPFDTKHSGSNGLSGKATKPASTGLNTKPLLVSRPPLATLARSQNTTKPPP